MTQLYKNKFIKSFLLLFLLIGISPLITNAQLITLGTGTTASANTEATPINGYYNYLRHQALYTKAEINAAGVTGPALITKLAYYVTVAPAGGVPNWELRVANTTAADASAHNAAVLTTVYTNANPTWVINSWNTLTFSTPFLWDGTSNLLVDVDLGLAPFTGPYGSMYTYPATNGSRYIRCDACGSQANSVTNAQLQVKPQVQLTFTPAAACTGTPAPGNTLSSTNPVCGGVNFTLSVQNLTAGTGVLYQWQSSPNGSTWSNIIGANNSTYTTTQGVATYYRLLVTCGGNTANSTALLVNQNPANACYCTPGVTGCAFSDVITNVTFAGINNTSACSATNGYTNYTTTVAAGVIAPNTTVPIAVTVGPGGTEYVGVWIDYNQNGTFEGSEFTAIGSANGATISSNIVVPASALPGSTRMRVRVRYNAAFVGATDACTGYTYGETEDYAITIVSCTTGAFTSQPSNASIVCSSNVTFTAAANGTAITYQWQESTNGGATYSNITNGGIYSGATTNTLTLTGVPIGYNNYRYRLVLNGTCTPANFASTAATLTVTQPSAPTVSPTNPVVCAGGITPISITSAGGTPGTVTVSSGVISVPVPDNSATGASHTLAVSTIPAGSIITGISVKWNMPHTWDGDMIFNLKAPNGNILNLDYYLSATGGAGPTTGFTNTTISSATGLPAISTGPPPYSGTYKPDANVGGGAGFTIAGPAAFPANTSTFGGLFSVGNGNWTLAMADGGGGDVGTLTSWSLTFTYASPASGIFSPNTGLFLDAAATIPYAGTSVNTVYAKPATATTYSVTLTQGGCTSPATLVPVTVNTPASITTQPTATSVCAGSNTSFSVTAAGTAPLTYQWQVSTDGGLTYTNVSGATSSTFALNGATIAMNGNRYQVVVTGASPCGSVTSSAVILTVNALPKITISASPTTKLIPTSTTTLTASVTPAGNGTFKWFRNGVQVPGASTGTLKIDIDHLGDYNALVTDANGCTSALSNIVTISDTASGKLFLYPNPSNGKFHVRFYTQFYTPNALPPSPINATEIRYIAVYNSFGQRIMEKPYSVYAPYGSMDIDLTPYGKGIYWIQVKDVQGAKLAIGRAVVL